MNILVFSDTHLYLPYEERKFNFLKKIISSADRVIINGDFFDGYIISFNDFVKSQWNKLFPLLKKRRAVYIYGNHDPKKISDKRVNLFSDIQTDQYKLKINKIIFYFEHGQKIRITPEVLLKMDFFKLSWIIPFFVKINQFFQQLLIKIFGRFFIIWFAYRNYPAKIKIKKLYSPKDNEIYIIGHNHFGEVDEKNHFAATGIILYGFAQYLTIENGRLKLHEDWYK